MTQNGKHLQNYIFSNMHGPWVVAMLSMSCFISFLSCANGRLNFRLEQLLKVERNYRIDEQIPATSMVTLPNFRQCLRLCWYSRKCTLASYHTETKLCRLFDLTFPLSTTAVRKQQGAVYASLEGVDMTLVPSEGCWSRPCDANKTCVPAWRGSLVSHTCDVREQDLAALSAPRRNTQVTTVMTDTTASANRDLSTQPASSVQQKTEASTHSPDTTESAASTTGFHTTNSPVSQTAIYTAVANVGAAGQLGSQLSVQNTQNAMQCDNSTLLMDNAKLELIPAFGSQTGVIKCDNLYMLYPESSTGIFHCSLATVTPTWVYDGSCKQRVYEAFSAPLRAVVYPQPELRGTWGICFKARIPLQSSWFAIELQGAGSIVIMRADVYLNHKGLGQETWLSAFSGAANTSTNIQFVSSPFPFVTDSDFELDFRLKSATEVQVQARTSLGVFDDYAVFVSSYTTTDLKAVKVMSDLYVHQMEIGCL